MTKKETVAKYEETGIRIIETDVKISNRSSL